MAIIRKGDKKAEKQLQAQAGEQMIARAKATPAENKKAGLVERGTITIIKDKKGKFSAERKLSSSKSVPFEGPISGSTGRKRQPEKSIRPGGSGVIKAGQVVKGDKVAKVVAKTQRAKKKSK